MELNTAALVGFRTRYETIFNTAFNLQEPQVEKIAFKVESGRVALVNHRWLRGLPGPREFIGSRVLNDVDSDGLIVTNQEWEDTISIRRTDLERDQYKLYDPMVSRMGQTAKLHRDKLAFELLSNMLANASSYKAYDGSNFFGAHSSNRAVSFTNSTTGVLSETNLITGITSLYNRRDTAGNPLAATSSKLLLIVPPGNKLTADKFANLTWFPTTQPGSGASSSSSQAGSGENVLKGMFDVVMSPYLKTQTEWHLTLVDPMYKPVIWQLEQDIEFLGYEKFLAQWSMNDLFVFGTRALYTVAPGLPEFVYSSTGTV